MATDSISYGQASCKPIVAKRCTNVSRCFSLSEIDSCKESSLCHISSLQSCGTIFVEQRLTSGVDIPHSQGSTVRKGLHLKQSSENLLKLAQQSSDFSVILINKARLPSLHSSLGGANEDGLSEKSDSLNKSDAAELTLIASRDFSNLSIHDFGSLSVSLVTRKSRSKLSISPQSSHRGDCNLNQYASRHRSTSCSPLKNHQLPNVHGSSRLRFSSTSTLKTSDSQVATDNVSIPKCSASYSRRLPSESKESMSSIANHSLNTDSLAMTNNSNESHSSQVNPRVNVASTAINARVVAQPVLPKPTSLSNFALCNTSPQVIDHQSWLLGSIPSEKYSSSVYVPRSFSHRDTIKANVGSSNLAFSSSDGDSRSFRTRWNSDEAPKTKKNLTGLKDKDHVMKTKVHSVSTQRPRSKHSFTGEEDNDLHKEAVDSSKPNGSSKGNEPVENIGINVNSTEHRTADDSQPSDDKPYSLKSNRKASESFPDKKLWHYCNVAADCCTQTKSRAASDPKDAEHSETYTKPRSKGKYFSPYRFKSTKEKQSKNFQDGDEKLNSNKHLGKPSYPMVERERTSTSLLNQNHEKRARKLKKKKTRSSKPEQNSLQPLPIFLNHPATHHPSAGTFAPRFVAGENSSSDLSSIDSRLVSSFKTQFRTRLKQAASQVNLSTSDSCLCIESIKRDSVRQAAKTRSEAANDQKSLLLKNCSRSPEFPREVVETLTKKPCRKKKRKTLNLRRGKMGMNGCAQNQMVSPFTLLQEAPLTKTKIAATHAFQTKNLYAVQRQSKLANKAMVDKAPTDPKSRRQRISRIYSQIKIPNVEGFVDKNQDKKCPVSKKKSDFPFRLSDRLSGERKANPVILNTEKRQTTNNEKLASPSTKLESVASLSTPFRKNVGKKVAKKPMKRAPSYAKEKKNAVAESWRRNQSSPPSIINAKRATDNERTAEDAMVKVGVRAMSRNALDVKKPQQLKEGGNTPSPKTPFMLLCVSKQQNTISTSTEDRNHMISSRYFSQNSSSLTPLPKKIGASSNATQAQEMTPAVPVWESATSRYTAVTSFRDKKLCKRRAIVGKIVSNTSQESVYKPFFARHLPYHSRLRPAEMSESTSTCSSMNSRDHKRVQLKGKPRYPLEQNTQEESQNLAGGDQGASSGGLSSSFSSVKSMTNLRLEHFKTMWHNQNTSKMSGLSKSRIYISSNSYIIPLRNLAWNSSSDRPQFAEESQKDPEVSAPGLQYGLLFVMLFIQIVLHYFVSSQ